ncbi:hypothetical protein BOTCAL_0050g00170 [Botryotinia calthae]|uniref:Uncharacterized protein n=1 Tax=Botryotinia calthae TaxID=38488 RepID=A0A4Y8DBD4_9HELO|nr:hypothetical protein BOTCAL_0050g00170 [Botryotinia calthae]
MVHNPKLQHDANFNSELQFGHNLNRGRARRYTQHKNPTSKVEDCNSGGGAEFRKHRRYRRSKIACNSGGFQFEGEVETNFPSIYILNLFNVDILQAPFERKFFFRTSKGQTIMPGLCRLDSGSDIPTRRWVKEARREAEISTNFKSPSSYSLSGHAMKFTGIVRNLVFNPEGFSTIYRRDFLVCDQLDSFVDFIIGAKFLLEEWQVLFGNMKRRIAGWFSHKKEMPAEQAEAQFLKDNQDKEAQEAELRRQDKKDAQHAREKEARRKQQDTNKSHVSQ